MPEGDTIFRAASRLRPKLAGQTLLGFRAPRVPRPHPRTGETIDLVEAKGKHLLIGFSGGLTLDSHLGMTGQWRLVETGRPWPQAEHLARCVIDVDGWQAVCFAAPTLRMLTPATEPAAHLGPDLCKPDADLDLALQRMDTIPDDDTTIAEVLLDQRVMAGIGNVFKSEVLWACRVDPFAAAASIDTATRKALILTAAKQLRANLGRGQRTTVRGHPGTLAVYGRNRQPCRRCGTPIRMQSHGALDRNTFWCPRCQPPVTGG